MMMMSAAHGILRLAVISSSIAVSRSIFAHVDRRKWQKTALGGI
jgi:hypothetical protein